MALSFIFRKLLRLMGGPHLQFLTELLIRHLDTGIGEQEDGLNTGPGPGSVSSVLSYLRRNHGEPVIHSRPQTRHSLVEDGGGSNLQFS